MNLPIITWDDVVTRHGSRAAVKRVNGKIKSILCGGVDHNDKVSDSLVEYSIPDRPFYRDVLVSFTEAMNDQAEFIVFFKVRQNNWCDLGKYKVSSIVKSDEFYKILLIRSIV